MNIAPPRKLPKDTIQQPQVASGHSMAGAARRQTPADYFTLPREESSAYNSISTPPFVWDQSPYSDPALLSSHSSDSFDSPIGTIGSLPFTSGQYNLDSSSTTDNIKREPELSNLSLNDSFDEWMSWDDPDSHALSPLLEPLSSTLKLEPMAFDMASIEPMSQDIKPMRNEFEDSMNSEPLFQASFSQDMAGPDARDLPPREGLYSTPLSWERPAPGHRQSTSPPAMSPTTMFDPTSSADVSALFSIAMPQATKIQSYGPGSLSSPPSSPEPDSTMNDSAQRKRKSSSDDSSPSPPPTSRRHAPKKTAHNMIEKRYRTNLNDKITALRDSVPSLRIAAEAASLSKARSGSSNNSPVAPSSSRSRDMSLSSQNLDFESEVATPHQKLNKATVLSKATEYIAQLEKRSKNLTKENTHLKARIDAFEALLMGQSNLGRQIYNEGQQGPTNYSQRNLPPLQQNSRTQRR